MLLSEFSDFHKQENSDTPLIYIYIYIYIYMYKAQFLLSNDRVDTAIWMHHKDAN